MTTKNIVLDLISQDGRWQVIRRWIPEGSWRVKTAPSPQECLARATWGHQAVGKSLLQTVPGADTTPEPSPCCPSKEPPAHQPMSFGW